MHILLVEDDHALADGICRALRQFGYAMDWASTGEQVLTCLTKSPYDLVILDIGLPDMNGFDVIKSIRANKITIPVLMLTARDALSDRVKGLDLGADDYLIKPIATVELAARARALMRRSQQSHDTLLVHGPMSLDLVGKRAWLNDKPLKLSSREWAVLEYLIKRRGRIVSKEQILDSFSGINDDLSLNAIEMYIHRLRSKLSDGQIEIRTVRGLGYLMEKPDA